MKVKPYFKEMTEKIFSLKDYDNQNFKLRLYPIKLNDLSFADFTNPITKETKPVLGWCKDCGKSSICGRCPSKLNNYNKDRRKKIFNFKQGILLQIKVPAKLLAGQKALGENSPAKTQRLINTCLKIIEDILRKKGATDFYKLAAGSCKLAYCQDEECTILQGLPCRHPEANDILECTGINVFQTLINLGAEIYYWRM